MKKFAMVMTAAALLSSGLLLAAAVSNPVATSATLRATCMSDGSMRIASDALAAARP